MLGCARLCSTVPGLAGSSARRSFSPHLIKARVPRNYTINFFLYSPISFCNQFRDVSFGVWLMSWNYTNLDFESSGFLQRPLLAVRFNGIFWCLSVYHKIASVLYFHLFFRFSLYSWVWNIYGNGSSELTKRYLNVGHFKIQGRNRLVKVKRKHFVHTSST